MMNGASSNPSKDRVSRYEAVCVLFLPSVDPTWIHGQLLLQESPTRLTVAFRLRELPVDDCCRCPGYGRYRLTFVRNGRESRGINVEKKGDLAVRLESEDMDDPMKSSCIRRNPERECTCFFDTDSTKTPQELGMDIFEQFFPTVVAASVDLTDASVCLGVMHVDAEVLDEVLE